MELLTTDQMARADALTIAAGIDEFDLVCTAAARVVNCICKRFASYRQVLVLCGPGNNGADGYVTARMLRDAGIEVSVVSVADADKPDSVCTQARTHWGEQVTQRQHWQPDASTLVVDAMFGAGLSRALVGDAARWVECLRNAKCPVLSIDVPSGLDGDSGMATGAVIDADVTVTFFRQKPGHLLYPGRALCGELVLADIGISADVLTQVTPQYFENTPQLWADAWPPTHSEQHKYQRGHALVFSGPIHATGAARLSAYAALRAGAGLVTLACPVDALTVAASHLTAVMIAPWADRTDFDGILDDTRKNAVVIGPGFGLGADTRVRVEQVLQRAASVVLDADALTAFESHGEHFVQLLQQAAGQVVLTPHDGEYRRLFHCDANRLERARHAARQTGAIVVLKGSDSVIADPTGRVAVNANAPPTLATAGSGDVLAGIICGLMAQQMPTFEAACCAVWMHSECANAFGEGLIAEDLADQLPAVITRLKGAQVDASS